MKLLKIFSLIATLCMTACSAHATNPNVEVVSPEVFQTKLAADTGAYLFDVRKPDEFAAGHLVGAHLLNWLDPETFKRHAKNIDKRKTIYVYCRSGRRSNAAANYLAKQGYNVVDMDGGILAWEKAGLQVTTEDTKDFSESDIMVKSLDLVDMSAMNPAAMPEIFLKMNNI